MLNPLIYIDFHGLLQLSAGSGQVGDACTAGAAQLASKYFTIFIIQYYIYSQVVYVNNITVLYAALSYCTIYTSIQSQLHETHNIEISFPSIIKDVGFSTLFMVALAVAIKIAL